MRNTIWVRQHYGPMTQYFLEDWITEHFSFVRPIVKLLCALLQSEACLSVHSTSVSEEKDRDKVAVCETTTSWRGVLSNEEVVTKEEKEDIQLHVDPMCLSSPSEQAYGREKTQNHTLSSPPQVFVITSPLCVFVGVWVRETMLSHRARAL